MSLKKAHSQSHSPESPYADKELFVEAFIRSSRVVEGRNLVAMDSDGFSDPYVILQVGQAKQKTKIINRTLNPVWDIGSSPEKFIFNSKKLQGQTELHVICMDWDRFSTDDRMGMCVFKLSELEDGVPRDDWFALKPQKKGDPVSGELHLRLHLRPRGADSSSGKKTEKSRHSALWKAVKNGDFGEVTALLAADGKGESIDPWSERSSQNKTILHMAVERPSFSEDAVRILKALVSHPKSNVALADDQGNTALHAFAKNFKSPACKEPFELYMKKGANVNAPNHAGETPLHSAVLNPTVKLLLAELLLERKADPNAKSDKGETPLHFAVRIGRKDMVKLLIAHGADTSLPGRDGLSAVGIAKKAGFTTIADTIRDSIELKKFLEKHSLEKLLKPFLEEELYLYLLPDIPDSTLSKFVPNDAERAKLLELAREATKGAAEGEERAARKRQHLKALDEVRQRESDMRKSLRESLMRSRSSAVAKPDDPKNDFEIDPGDLEFVKSLGSGTSGEVFKGLYLAKAVAVKVLKSSNTPKEKDEFIAEFKIIASLDSSYIVHFFGAVVKEKLALVMEYCDRGSLYNVLQDEDVDIGWQLSFDMLEEVVKGIQVLHSHNPPIMHRDLKTLNVLVTHDFHCKLCDFGLARFDTASNLGTLQNCRGTYAYIAPEVYEGKKFTLYADIYAVSIMTWEFAVRCMKGKYETPYKEFPFIKMEFQIIVQASMKNLRPTIPPKFPFPNLISDVWAKDPASRPLSEELLKRFAEVRKDYDSKKAEWDALLVKPVKGSKDKK